MSLLKGIPISEDQCMGDSLPIINEALSSIDVNLTTALTELADVTSGLATKASKSELNGYVKFPSDSLNGHSLIFNGGTGLWESKSPFPQTASPFQVLTYNGSTATWVASAAPGSGVGRDVHGIVFNGEVAGGLNFSGSFSRTSVNTNININNHGLLTSHRVYLNFSNAIESRDYVITVVNEHNFTINVAGTAATGTVYFRLCDSYKTKGFYGINYCSTGSYIALLTEYKALNSVISLLPSGRTSNGSIATGIIPIVDMLGVNNPCQRTENSFGFITTNTSNVVADAGEKTSISLITY